MQRPSPIAETSKLPSLRPYLRRGLLPVALALVAYGHVAGKFLHWACPLRATFHVPCPTCGMTRATSALLHLDLRGAMRMNPLAPVVLPLLALLVAVELGGYVATGDFGLATNKKAVRVAGLATCTALFVVWVARFFGAFGGPVR